ncbi:MAG TPA: pyruvate kinase [Polyangia bacterium]|jgi:pyruvate kinase|nr:pyruvate kinase [Polyangia bacterium]
MLKFAGRTKIIATMGPALDAEGVLERLLDSGVDVLRVNLSHASPRDQAARVRRARAHRPDIAVLADLGGPKLRLGELREEVKVRSGDLVTLGEGGIPVADASLYDRVRPDDPVYIADGTIDLVTVEVRSDRIVCRVRVGGTLRSRKGINLPNDTSSLPALTDKDRADLADVGVLAPDYIAISYVRHENDVADARALTSLPIVAKIEKQQALERLDAILGAADAIMVARGDLGVEIPIERVPAAQKRLIRAANLAGRPVITATQMLVSMVSSPLPTRAEVTDVANAVLDGTDAVMLSEETAVGQDPVGVVQMMSRLLCETEPLLGPHPAPALRDDAYALAHAAATLAEELNAAAIVVPTRTGVSAMRLAAFRPRRPVLAYSRVPDVTRRLQLVWGVRPIDLRPVPGLDNLHATLAAAGRDLPPGSRAVVLDIAPEGSSAPSLVNAIRF